MSETKIICGTGLQIEPSIKGLISALDAVSVAIVDPFVIVARSGQQYMQCLNKGDWKLEKREGSEGEHFEASRTNLEPPAPEKIAFLDKILARREVLSVRLNRDEVEEAMTAYLEGNADPDWIIWTRIEV